MGSHAGPVLPKQPLTQRIRAVFCAPSSALTTWLDHTLRVNVYELGGDEIVSGRGRRPEDRVEVRKIVAWQIHAEMGFDIVVIGLEDGRSFNWLDKYNDLIGLLRRVARERERPWNFA